MGNKMDIELDNLIEVLAFYNITEQISDFSFFINWYEENN